VQKVDIAVVGTGVAGSAAARALARAGRGVVVFEQFELGHARGSSHGTSRIFRFSYDDPNFVRMAMDSLPLWRELEGESGEQLIVTLGGIDCGKDVDSHVRALAQCDADYEVLSAEQASARFPRLRLPAAQHVLFHPDAGIALTDRALRAFIGSARAAGADVRDRTKVTDLGVDGSRAILSTDDDTVSAEVAVIAAGAWARDLLRPVGVDLPVVATRETVAYFPMADELSVPTIVDWMELGAAHAWGDTAIYGLPSPGLGIKAGEHHVGPVTDPDDPGEVSDESVERIARWVAERYPEADPHPATAETCIYTNTDDERFLLELHGPFVVGSACSGHGFKFGPLTGLRLAQLAGESVSART
jgi:sarcosine oxidase